MTSQACVRARGRKYPSLFVRSDLSLPAQQLGELWRDRLFPSTAFCSRNKESKLVEIQRIKAGLKNLTVPHGRVQTECYEQPAVRIIVGNGSLH